mgnify:CR=1 FL=1
MSQDFSSAVAERAAQADKEKAKLQERAKEARAARYSEAQKLCLTAIDSLGHYSSREFINIRGLSVKERNSLLETLNKSPHLDAFIHRQGVQIPQGHICVELSRTGPAGTYTG